MQWIDLQALVAHSTAQDIFHLYQKKDTTESTNSKYFTNFSQTIQHNDRIANSNVLNSTINKLLSGQAEKLQKVRLDNCQKDFDEIVEPNSLNTDETTVLAYSFVKNKSKILSRSQKEIYHDVDISSISSAARHSIDTRNITGLKVALDNIKHRKEACDSDCTTSVTNNEPLNLVVNSKDNTQRDCIYSGPEERLYSHSYSSAVEKKTLSVDSAVLKQIDHFSDVQNCYNTKYKNIDYGLLKLSDLELSCNSDRSKKLLETIGKLHTGNSEINRKIVTNGDLKQEKAHILDKYVTHVLPLRLGDGKPKELSWTYLQSNVKCNNIKKECCIEEEAHKSENSDLITACNPTLGNWVCFEMSGQYPGHSRPPVGTPPPQNVWNHLTMTQNQGNFNFNLLYFSFTKFSMVFLIVDIIFNHFQLSIFIRQRCPAPRSVQPGFTRIHPWREHPICRLNSLRNSHIRKHRRHGTRPQSLRKASHRQTHRAVRCSVYKCWWTIDRVKTSTETRPVRRARWISRLHRRLFRRIILEYLKIFLSV